MKSKTQTMIILLTIAMLVFTVGCSKNEPVSEPQVTKEPVPAVPVVDDEGVQDVVSDNTTDNPSMNDTDMTNNNTEDTNNTIDLEDDEGVTDVNENDDLTAENYRVISLKDLNAYPSEMEIKVGTTVEWRNVNDNFQHIIGWKNQKGMGVQPEPIHQGESWSYTFTEPMEIKWFSTARPTIQGTITVIADNSSEESINDSTE